MYKLFHEDAKIHAATVIGKFFSPGHPFEVQN